MKLTDLHAKLLGRWTGNTTLYLPWLPVPEHKSKTGLAVHLAAKGRFLSFTYTWWHEAKEHEGILLVGNANKQEAATGAWVDSWHMGEKVMALAGDVSEEGIITLRGSYEAPPDPDWGWRITLSCPTHELLRMVMHNITPDGKEELAVVSDFSREKS